MTSTECKLESWSDERADQRQEGGQVMGGIVRLLSQHSLAEWPSLLEELSGEDWPVMEDFYSILTFEPFVKTSISSVCTSEKLSHSVLVVR